MQDGKMKAEIKIVKKMKKNKLMNCKQEKKSWANKGTDSEKEKFIKKQ